MKTEPRSAARYLSTNSLWLLVSLLVSLLILPLLEGIAAGRVLSLVGLTITFVLGATTADPRVRFVLTIVLVVAIPTAWATLFLDWTPLFVTHCLLGSVFFWVVGGGIVFVVIRSRKGISFDSVYGAISAYLLFGLAWALTYWSIHSVRPEAFSLEAANHADFSEFIYYSFVTMSTLGYGDITPLNRVTRTLSWIQSVTGQFYVAVIIAWLVSALPRPGAIHKEPANPA